MTDNPPPQFEFHGLRFFVARDGDRTTGRVVFPYRTAIGETCPIDYRRTDQPSDSARVHAGRSWIRLESVRRYKAIIDSRGKRTKRDVAQDVVIQFMHAFSVRTLQSWVRKYDLEGAAGLEDKYTAAPKSVLECTAEQAKDALLVCTWWAFRIGCGTGWKPVIDTKMMHALLRPRKGDKPGGAIAEGAPAADLLATIDCYYSWSCDRERYPFKPFARWARYDIVTWALRAADRNDYRRAAFSAERKEQVPLCAPINGKPSTIPPAKQRFRETSDRRTRESIRNLDSGVRRRRIPARHRSADEAPPSHLPTLSPSHPDGPSTMQGARTLNRLGFTGAARSITAGMVTTGPEPIAANQDPQTMAEALGILEDRWRLMLIRAAQGDREELDAAVVTISQWWDAMPTAVRSNIDARSKHWRIDHPVSDNAADRRRVQQMLVHLRRRPGTNRLAVAMRLPS